MAFDKWTLLYSASILMISGIGEIDAQSCGGTYTYTATYGVFTSPNYPNVYDLDCRCTYKITLSTISSITLSFETFELDRSEIDFVSITCESNSSFLEKRYYYFTNIQPISIPWCSYGEIYFYSDSDRYYSTKGFRFQYQVSTKDCGNTVHNASSGIISSPNYPQSYNNNENCTYSIFASESSSYTLSFNAFHLEPDCQRDWLQIRCDNSTYISPKYCGSTLPKPAYISNCHKVLIWFHTDSSIVFSGFSLQYSVIPDGCGKKNYAGLSGIITSPNYPKRPSDIGCNYYLYPVSSVALAFQSFDLEPFSASSYGDSVDIDLFSYSGDVYHKFRGNTLPPLISCPLCHRVSISCNFNYVIAGTGFNLRYQVNPLVAHSAITNAPKNFTVDVGSQVQLDCTSDATDYYPSWTLSRDEADENTTVIASFCYYTPGDDSKYSVVKGGPGVCRLVITNATLADAGIYTCIDVGLASSSSVVTVVVPTTTSTSSSQATTTTSTLSGQVPTSTFTLNGQDPTTTSPSSYQVQTDSDVIEIVLAVLLAISALGYIGIAIYFVVRRCKETSREKDQRKTNQGMRPANDSVKTPATGSVYEDIVVPVLSSESSTTATRNDECGYEHLNHGFDNPAAYDALKRQSTLH